MLAASIVVSIEAISPAVRCVDRMIALRAITPPVLTMALINHLIAFPEEQNALQFCSASKFVPPHSYLIRDRAVPNQ